MHATDRAWKCMFAQCIELCWPTVRDGLNERNVSDAVHVLQPHKLTLLGLTWAKSTLKDIHCQ